MPDGWESKSVSDLCSRVTSGGTPSRKRADYYAPAGQGTPWVKTKELRDSFIHSTEEHISEAGSMNSSAKLLPEGTVLMAMYGATVGKLGILGRPMACNQAACAMIVNPSAGNNRFLFYRLLHDRPALVNLANGAAQQNLSGQVIKAFRFPCPPVAEQQAIAGVLGSLDDLIDTNRRIADDCTTLWRAIARDALADASDFSPLSELADFVNGKNFTQGALGDGRPVIRTPEVRRGPEAGTVRSDADAADANIAREGDILFVWSGSLTVGRWMWEEGLINQHVFKVLPKREVPAWLVFALVEYQMPWFLSLAADKATTMGHIKREHLDAAVPMPSSTEIERLGPIIEPLWDEALQCGIAAQHLAVARDELLPLLITGRVWVGDGAV